MAATNPFHSHERVNFPDFSPSLFSVSKKIPSNSESSGGKGFNWSIDQMARLDPVEIATDMQSFVSTNGHSPAIGPEVQRSVDKFFSQNTIQPSPWAINKPRQLQKHVTFSPHPPATNYYAQESFCGSQNSTDVCTQTMLSIPVKYDIEKKLAGTDLFAGEDSSQRNGDAANSSLIRRKLFGQPQRESMNSSDTSERDESDLFSPQTSARSLSEIFRPVPTISVTPDIVTKSSRGWGQQDHAAALCSSPFSSSSLLVANPSLDQLPSPIADMSLASITPIKPLSTKESSAVPLARHGNEMTSFQSTPCPKKQLNSCDWQLGTHEPVSPILMSTPAHYKSSVTMATPADESTKSSQQSTSTPYNQKQVKRQLPLSPLASPLMKEKHSNNKENEEEGKEEEEECDGPAPLLLADLESEVVDMTTSHTYFPHYSSSTAHMDSLSSHPLHSLFTSSPWRPNQHSTMLHQQQRPLHQDHPMQKLPTLNSITTESPSVRPAISVGPVYSSTASTDSCVMTYQDSAFSSCFHPTRSGLGLLDSVDHHSSTKQAKHPDVSLMEMSFHGQQEEADSGILAMADTEHPRRIEKSEGLSSSPAVTTQHGPSVPTPPSLEAAQPTTFVPVAPFSRSTPMPWITSTKLNLPHTPFPSPFTLHNANILHPRLRNTASSQTRIVPQYSPRAAECSSPFSDELLRRKAYLKAKLKFNSNIQTYYYTDENTTYHIKSTVCSPTGEDKQFRIRSPLLEKTRQYSRTT